MPESAPQTESAHPFDGVDLRAEPERYRIGRGEYGLFHAEPYKSELLPLWRFRTPVIAEESASALWEKYEGYREAGDFVGMDLARKFIQMGYTRSRRYAARAGGRKYADDGTELPRREYEDPEKAESARIFKARWDAIREDPAYQSAKEQWQREMKAS
jgi:hypothetical protein